MGGRWRKVQDGGTHVHVWLIHVDVWQKPPQYCKVISLQLNLKNKVNKKKKILNSSAEVLSPPLALFIVMLPKAHLTPDSMMSGSR